MRRSYIVPGSGTATAYVPVPVGRVSAIGSCRRCPRSRCTRSGPTAPTTGFALPITLTSPRARPPCRQRVRRDDGRGGEVRDVERRRVRGRIARTRRRTAPPAASVSENAPFASAVDLDRRLARRARATPTGTMLRLRAATSGRSPSASTSRAVDDARQRRRVERRPAERPSYRAPPTREVAAAGSITADSGAAARASSAARRCASAVAATRATSPRRWRRRRCPRWRASRRP